MKTVSKSVKSLVITAVLVISTSFSFVAHAGSSPKQTASEDSFATCAGTGFGLALMPVMGTAYTGIMAFFLSAMSHRDQSECVSGLIAGHAVGIAADIALLVTLYKYKGAQAAGLGVIAPLLLGLALVAPNN